MKHALILLPALLVAACATSGSYGPADGPGDVGYSEQQIETNRFRVTYRAGDAIAAEDGALRRAAEVTLEEGYDYFTVVARATDRERARSDGARVGVSGRTGGYGGGVGIGVSVPIGGRDGRVAVRLEIVMGKGTKLVDPDTYDAADLLSRMR